MKGISQSVRELVRLRANNRCEYCQTDQVISGAQMHIEHIMPLSEGGPSTEENLCLSCAWCNSYKWAKIEAADPHTDKLTPLFNPRTQQWGEHFQWRENGIIIAGLSDTGRATIKALKMNNSFIVPARRHWVEAGWHPPQD
jgi:hypothetical protein